MWVAESARGLGSAGDCSPSSSAAPLEHADTGARLETNKVPDRGDRPLPLRGLRRGPAFNDQPYATTGSRSAYASPANALAAGVGFEPTKRLGTV